ncbi:archaeal heat shock protein Hsp20 [Hyperthermus butylicus]|uniref:Small heat shock protein n=1 Tax=Hyperthermus butylicus (strain DSM 5456 / JCM 9403 / PLM1-5) TaxID=415426 RepID=A2BM79_HYPBU|nr:archaeal heat shock protein Hsp20 [Hyperthermus butylicus]ABM81090.1 putative small heat shock protein [Hyperthermus butylicus DSM 5456]
MSFIWRRRFSDIFDEIEEMIREMERLAEAMLGGFETRMPRGEFKGPIVYGVRITIGPDGRPIIEEFGNVKRRGRRAIIEEAVEPLVEVIDEKDKVVVIAEIPGVEKDKIDIRIKDGKLIIRAEDRERKYYKEIELPPNIKPETAKAKYKNGVLEVTIEKEKPEEEKEEGGIRVKVE